MQEAELSQQLLLEPQPQLLLLELQLLLEPQPQLLVEPQQLLLDEDENSAPVLQSLHLALP